ncbi:hypothetical protein FB451DRAFT_80349 [Mycena latifolia]|nr:hypothetical protein FB451DRAFT_80349 [Mycena latifolia]
MPSARRRMCTGGIDGPPRLAEEKILDCSRPLPLQELVLSFRKVHDEGFNLADNIIERIDVLIVSLCSPEAVYKTLSSARYSGTDDPFPEANMNWWADKLGQNKDRVFRLLCDHSPLLNPLPTPGPAEIAHARIICEAAGVWQEFSDERLVLRALPHVVSSCTLSESDLSLWFPTEASPYIFLAKVFGEIIKRTRERLKLDNRGEVLINAQIILR